MKHAAKSTPAFPVGALPSRRQAIKLAAMLAAAQPLVLASNSASAQSQIWTKQGWKTDFSKTNIKFSEIMSGGPPKDGIPSIDNPKFVPVSKVKNLSPKDPVLSVTVGNVSKSYPLRVLIWHEIVNDVVGGRPLTITYCPLCNSGIVFDRRVGEKILDFGTTGKLRNSDLVMYDRQTESWWQQFTGEAIVGAYTGTKLNMVPARLESFADFKARKPNGNVLIPNSRLRPYGQNPYTGYDTSRKPFLYRGEMPDGIEPLARVVVVRQQGKMPLVVSLAHIRAKKQVTIKGVVLHWKPGQASALDKSLISAGRDVGSVTAQVVTGGEPADVPYDVTFAFVAHAFHKDAKIIMK